LHNVNDGNVVEDMHSLITSNKTRNSCDTGKSPGLGTGPKALF